MAVVASPHLAVVRYPGGMPELGTTPTDPDEPTAASPELLAEAERLKAMVKKEQQPKPTCTRHPDRDASHALHRAEGWTPPTGGEDPGPNYLCAACIGEIRHHIDTEVVAGQQQASRDLIKPI